MKKKLLIIFLAAVSCLTCVLGLAACNNSENENHQHNLVAVQGKSATCTETGILEHWRCETCDKLFSDKNGTAEIENTTIPALGHDFVGGVCTRCGAADPNDDTLLDGKELKNIKISAQGMLTWSRLKIASKYSVKISSAEGDRMYEIPKSEGSFDLNALPENEKLRYGKNSVTLTVYQYQEEQIGGETIGDDVPVSSDSFLAVSKNGGYSLVRTTYADENLTIKGAYSDVREDTDGNEYILIDKEIPQGNKDVSFNLLQSVKKAAENVTVKYYKNEIDRANDKNAISGNNWHREVITPGDNFYYLRVTCADGSGRDYTVKVCGVRYVTFYFMSFVSSGKDEDGYNVYQYESIGESTVLLENDYFDIDSLYASIDENKVIVDENLNVYEKGGDYMVPFSKSTAASASFSLFCTDKTFIDAQKAEVELYKDLFELTYSGWTNGKGNQWLLRFKADSNETNLVVPSEIFGDRVVLTRNSFRNAANLQSVIFADGFTSLPDRLFANGCASLESVTIPASITSAYSLGDWMFSEDLKDQLTIYCEGDIESDNWNRVPNQMAYFRTYTNQEGASSTVTVNGVRIKVDAEANEAEVLSASGENIVIPDTVRFGAKYYPVTSVKENAAISAVSVFLGKNIESLGEGWITDTILSVEADAENPYFVTSNGILYEKDGWKFRFMPQSLTGSVAIPEGVTNIPAQCFENRSGITEILFPSSLLSVGERAFYGCTGLHSVVLPENVSSVGFAAFGGCSGIETVTLPFVGAGADGTGAAHFGYLFGAASYSEQNRYLPQTLTQVTFTGDQLYDYAFYGCTTIAEVRLPNELTRIPNYAFYGCTSLVSVEIPDNVDAIGSYAFSGCSGLETFVYRGDGRIDDRAFENCVKLAEIVIPNATSVYSSAFTGCAELRTAEIPADTIGALPTSVETVTVTKGMINSFAGQKSLKNVIISAEVTYVAYRAFDGCGAMETITVSSDNDNYYGNGKCLVRASDDSLIYAVPVSVLTIPEGVKTISNLGQEICSILNNLQIPVSLTEIDASIFSTCPLLDSFEVSAGNPQYFTEDGCLLQRDTGAVVLGGADVETLPATAVSVGTYAFSGRNISSIVIPDGVQSIENFAFCDCKELQAVSLPDNLQILGDAVFSGCDSLQYTVLNEGYYLGNESNPYLLLSEVRQKEIDSIDISPKTRLIGGSAFLFCNQLKTIVIPDSVVGIGMNAFNSCRSLIKITIGSNVVDIGSSAFSGCEKLKEVYNRSSLDITKGSSDYGQVAYYAVNVYTPSSGESILNVTDDGYIFYNDEGTVNLLGYTGTETALVLPDNFNGQSYIIADRAFYGFHNLKSVVISGGVTSIGDSAFAHCNSLAVVTISDDVTNIGSGAFFNCYSIVSLTIGSSVNSIPRDAFSSNKIVEVYNRSSLDVGINGEYSFIGYNALNIYTPSSGTSKLTMTEDGCIFYSDGETVHLVGYMGTESEVILPESFNGKEYSIYKYAFYNLNSLRKIVLSDGVTSIGDSAFGNCTSLERVTVNVEELDPLVFMGCDSLVHLTIGTKVNYLGAIYNAFYNALPALEEITYLGTKTQWNSIFRNSSWNKYTIHCTDGDITKS